MNPALGLAVGRIGLGATALLTPRLFARLARLDPDRNPQLTVPTRLFASREMVLGAATLFTRGEVQRNLVLAGVAVDGADAFAGLAAAVSGDVEKRTGVMLAIPATAAVVAGLVALPPDGAPLS